jgi:hypothetical protein
VLHVWFKHMFFFRLQWLSWEYCIQRGLPDLITPSLSLKNDWLTKTQQRCISTNFYTFFVFFFSENFQRLKSVDCQRQLHLKGGVVCLITIKHNHHHQHTTSNKHNKQPSNNITIKHNKHQTKPMLISQGMSQEFQLKRNRAALESWGEMHLK